MSKMGTIEVILRDALAYARKHGRTPYSISDPVSKRGCLLNHIGMAESRTKTTGGTALERLVAKATGRRWYFQVARWNDAQKSFAPVEAALEKAVAMAHAMGL